MGGHRVLDFFCRELYCRQRGQLFPEQTFHVQKPGTRRRGNTAVYHKHFHMLFSGLWPGKACCCMGAGQFLYGGTAAGESDNAGRFRAVRAVQLLWATVFRLSGKKLSLFIYKIYSTVGKGIKSHFNTQKYPAKERTLLLLQGIFLIIHLYAGYTGLPVPSHL